jgi:hypothetical protein
MLKGLWTIRRVIWGKLDQDGSVRPDLNMVSTGLFCRTNSARNVSLGDVGRASGHFNASRQKAIRWSLCPNARGLTRKDWVWRTSRFAPAGSWGQPLERQNKRARAVLAGPSMVKNAT